MRGELQLCDRWGIPHSLFRGIGDGTWTARDRAKALAFLEYQRTVCPQCNTRYDDWDHGGDGEEDAWAVTVQRCVGCQVIADKHAELELCARWGIPHSQFLGVSAGRWTERDREKALAYRDYENSLCASCRTRPEDWDHGHDGEEDAYAVTVQRCVGCQVIADKQAELGREDTDTHGVKVGLIPIAAAAALRLQREHAGTRRTTTDDD